MRRETDLTCRELVELVTDYLERALPDDVRVRLERHLGDCGDCHEYLRQIELTIATVGRPRDDDLPPRLRDALLAASAAR
jgi:hypothetical protein